jgi:hypothetical protein
MPSPRTPPPGSTAPNTFEILIQPPTPDAANVLTPVQGARSEEINHFLPSIIRTTAIEANLNPPPEYIRFQSSASIAFRFMNNLELKTIKDFVKQVSKKLLTACFTSNLFPSYWIVDTTMEINSSVVANTLFTELRNVHIHNAAEGVWSATTVITLPINNNTVKILAADKPGNSAECHIHFTHGIEVLEYLLKRNYVFLSSLSILDTSPICYWKKLAMKIHDPRDYSLEQFLHSFDGAQGGKFPAAADRLLILETLDDSGILILLPEFGMYGMKLPNSAKQLLILKAFQEGFIHYQVISTPLGKYHQLTRKEDPTILNPTPYSSTNTIPTVSSYTPTGSANAVSTSASTTTIDGNVVPLVEATIVPSGGRIPTTSIAMNNVIDLGVVAGASTAGNANPSANGSITMSATPAPTTTSTNTSATTMSSTSSPNPTV